MKKINLKELTNVLNEKELKNITGGSIGMPCATGPGYCSGTCPGPLACVQTPDGCRCY